VVLIKKISDYVTRNKQVLPVILDKRMNTYLENFIGKIALDNGILPARIKDDEVWFDPELNNSNSRKQLYQKVIDLSRVFEDPDINHYGDKRCEILKAGGTLSDTLAERAAVCRELSCFGHIVLTCYGINSYVANGIIPNEGGHAWIETNGNTVIDMNYIRKAVSKNAYIGKNPLNRQKLVEITF